MSYYAVQQACYDQAWWEKFENYFNLLLRLL